MSDPDRPRESRLASDSWEVGQDLARAESDLASHNGMGSASSEERDVVDEAERVQDELERRSNASSQSRKSSSNGRLSQHLSGMRARQSDAASDVGSSAPSEGTSTSARAVYRSTFGGAPASSWEGGEPKPSTGPDSVTVEAMTAYDQALKQDQDNQERIAAEIRRAKLHAGDKAKAQKAAVAVSAAAASAAAAIAIGKRDTTGSSGSGSHLGSGACGGSMGGSSSNLGGSAAGGGSGVAGSGVAGSGVGGSGVGSGSSAAGNMLTPASTSTFSSSMADTLLPRTFMESLNEETRRAVDAAMSLVVQQTGQEMAMMQATLDENRSLLDIATEDKENLAAKLLVLKVAAQGNQDLVAALALSREETTRATDDADALKDKMAGLEARFDLKKKRHEKDMQTQKDKAKKSAQAHEDLLKEKADLKELLAESRVEEAAESKKRVAAEEKGVNDRGKSCIDQDALQSQVDDLQGKLASANRELDRRDKETVTRKGGALFNKEDDYQEQRLLEAKLTDARTQNMKISGDLSELRLEMLQANESREQERLDRLSSDWSRSVDGDAGQKLSRGVGHRRKRGPKPGMQLSSIDEDDPEDMLSQAGSNISGQVSSAANIVGDLKDFEDVPVMEKSLETIWTGRDSSASASTTLPDQPAMDFVEQLRLLREELGEAGDIYDVLSDEKKANDAENHAKIARIFAQMQVFREEANVGKDEIERLSRLLDDNGAESKSEMMKLTNMLSRQTKSAESSADYEVKIQRIEDTLYLYKTKLEEAEQQLTFSLESKRLMTVRLQDTQRELEAMEVRHHRIVQDLKAQLQLTTGGDPLEAEQAQHELIGRLLAAEEERNVVKNELEAQTVHWKALLEAEQQRHAVTQQKLEEAEALVDKEREFKTQVESSLKEKQRQVAQAQQQLVECQERLMQETEKIEKMKEIGSVTIPLMEWLRCPTRQRQQQEIPPAVGGSTQISTQSVVWEIVSTMRGVAALFCSSGSLKILDASKKACSVWGSTALRGSSLLTLVFDQAAASWLEAEMTSPQPFGKETSMDAFVLRTIGCVEFRTRLGSAFDSSVFYARFPAEPAHGKASCILMVVEPIDEEEERHKQFTKTSSKQQGAKHSMNHSDSQKSMTYWRSSAHSTASSVHSEDITANDSVSNVNGR